MESFDTPQTAEHYNRLAEKYETRWKKYLDHTHHHFLENIETHSSDIILDLSCGTGLLAQNLVKESHKFKKLILNDISAKMQQKARERFADRDDITFTNYSADKLAFNDNTFTKLFCLNSFHNYRNQQQVLAECHRVLQPSGKIYILDWNRSGFFRPVNWFIDKTGTEHIDTRSLTEIKQQLINHSFRLLLEKEWYFRYWKFYYVISEK